MMHALIAADSVLLAASWMSKINALSRENLVILTIAGQAIKSNPIFPHHEIEITIVDMLVYFAFCQLPLANLANMRRVRLCELRTNSFILCDLQFHNVLRWLSLSWRV